MSNLINNSSTVPLSANGVFRGQTIQVNQQYMTCTVSVNTDVSGTLTFNHSQDGFNFYTLGDSFAVNGQTHKEVILKGLYFYVKYTNDSVPQTLFNLFTKTSLNVRDQNASGGGAGGDVNITGCDITLPVSNSTIDSMTVTEGILQVNTVDVSTLATQQTVLDTYNLLNNNTSTGGLNVSLTALDGEKITNTVIDTKRGLDCNIINLPTTQAVSIAGAVSINVLDVNSTVYDFTNDSATMTQADDRFFIDRVRPDSWAFLNDKNQNGSNVYWYSNSTVSPLGVQNFNILHGDLESLYFVAGINRTDDINAIPFMAVFSPSSIAFYNSRWVYTLDPSVKLIQTEKVLLYYGIDPVHIYTNLRHVQLIKNVIASQGPQLETEVCYLMSVNSASGLGTSSVYFNLYNAGWILTDGVHNDFQFNSGIDSKKDLVLSKLTIAGDATSLAVAVSNTVVFSNAVLDSMTLTDSNLNVNIANTLDIPISNTALTYMSFKEVNAGTYGLEVVNRNVQQSYNYLFNVGDITITDETPTIDVRAFRLMSVFGDSTHTGGGSHNIIVQYSTNGLSDNWYDSPNVISTNASGKFALDLKDFCVSYIRFRFQVALDTLNMNVCLK